MSGLPIQVLQDRLRRAAAATERADLDALLITPSADLRYLIGLAGESHERLTCLVLPAGGQPRLVVPKLERPGLDRLPLDQLGVEVLDWTDHENPYQLLAGHGFDERAPVRVAVADAMPARHVLGLRQALPAAEQLLAGGVLRELRMRKDEAEIAALRKAGAAIDRVHARMGELLRPGRTEAAVGADIAEAIVAEGHVDSFVIVGSGPNGASPHHEVSDRVIQVGDVVVVDIGGPVAEGYHSDCTRTYSVGREPTEPVATAYEVLRTAQRLAVAAVRPGVTAEQVDATARDLIVSAGFGGNFMHRTGHGIGLELHEDPYIVAGNRLPVEPGMAFSVEPGIYFQGSWGARIEDIVVVTADGPEPLNTRSHELVVL